MAGKASAQLVRLGVFTILGILVFAMLVFTFRPIQTAMERGFSIVVHMRQASEITRGTRASTSR